MSVGRKQSEGSMKIMSDIANNNNNNLDKLAKKKKFITPLITCYSEIVTLFTRKLY